MALRAWSSSAAAGVRAAADRIASACRADAIIATSFAMADQVRLAVDAQRRRL